MSGTYVDVPLSTPLIKEFQKLEIWHLKFYISTMDDLVGTIIRIIMIDIVT